VTNGILLGCPIFLLAHTVNCVQTLKVRLEDQPDTKSVGECYVGKTARGFAAVLFNRGGAQNFTLALEDFVPAASIGAAAYTEHGAVMGGAVQWKVRDLWSKADVATLASNGVYTVAVPSQDSVMLTVVPVTAVTE
jgi:hypothetical protein